MVSTSKRSHYKSSSSASAHSTASAPALFLSPSSPLRFLFTASFHVTIMIHHSPSSDPLSAPESQTPPAKPPNPHHQQHTPNQPTGRYLPIIPSLQNHQQLTQRPGNLFSPPRSLQPAHTEQTSPLTAWTLVSGLVQGEQLRPPHPY